MDSYVADIESQMKKLTIESRAFIGGKYVTSLSGESFSSVNPANGQVLLDVTSCRDEDVDLSVKSARSAFESGSWSRAAPAERKRVLHKFADLILKNCHELAMLETLNVGKPIKSTIDGDIPGAAGCISWYAEAIDKVYGEVAASPNDMTTMIVREPLGVVAAVVPWNYPLAMACWKLGPALATGNSVILKPAEQSPLSAIRVASLALEAGIPPGVLNVVPGFGQTAGRALGLHLDVDCITFTGSTGVGKRFMQYSAESNAKRVCLEMGGKTPHIVLDDCDDLDSAARAVVDGIFTNSGQICNAGSRLIVEKGVKHKLLERVIEFSQQIQLGSPLDPKTKMGPVVSSDHLQRVLSYIELGSQEGASVVLGGTRELTQTGGYFVAPTIFDGVANRMRIAQEEIFGPVLSVIEVSDFSEAISVANDSIYGLAAAIWTTNLKKAHQAAKQLRAGVIWINCFARGNMAAPFGGFKQSGFSRDRSLHAIDNYTGWKTIWIAS